MLKKIIYELKAPKTQYNNFAKFHYRNVEDILEAVKPLLHKYESIINITDEIVYIGDRYYIKATAKYIGSDGTFEAIAFAREEEVKKGMDGSQITGSASSYARKYALNGLLLIDDNKDADTNIEDEKPPTEKQLQLLKKFNYDKKISFEQASATISALMEFELKTKNFSSDEKRALAQKYNFSKLSDLTAEEIQKINKEL